MDWQGVEVIPACVNNYCLNIQITNNQLYVARRRGNDWFRCDDAAVVIVPETEVVNSQAYLLLYTAAC